MSQTMHQTQSPPSRLDAVLGTTRDDDRRYIVYLLAIALFGWAMASYDFNLLVVTVPAIAKDLHLSSTQVGLMFFVVYAAMLVISLAVGWGMDVKGRRWMWMFALTGAAVFTGLTFFVQTFWQLVAVRALASGLANAELAISITLVNEQVPARRRGLLYSIVQGGWPLGVLVATAVWLVAQGLGWHVVFLFGVAPLVAVIIGRIWVRPSERFRHVQELKRVKESGDDRRVEELAQRYQIDAAEVEKVTVQQIFARPGWVRSQLLRTTLVWLLYSASFVATNVYIVYWLTQFRGVGKSQATVILLVAAGAGFFFYVLGGWLGERSGRQRILLLAAALTVVLNCVFYFIQGVAALAVVYFLLYQTTNGLWSGVGYAYWAESFPTRVRGTAVGWLGAMFTAGLIIGAGVWTALVGSAGPTATWWVVAVGFSAAALAATFLLPDIRPGQELEDIAS